MVADEAAWHQFVHHLMPLVIANYLEEAWAMQLLTEPYFKHSIYIGTALLLI